jgi:imidazole glycerol-phosphate synthase subunit HisH
LLFERSEEGDAPGLAILPGQVLKFSKADMHDNEGRKLKVPHMGWNQVYQAGQHPMWANIPDGERFYYVHSYYVLPQNLDSIIGYSEYPSRFTSVVASDNIFAVQFHPEKSQHVGLQLLSNFVQWNGRA